MTLADRLDALEARIVALERGNGALRERNQRRQAQAGVLRERIAAILAEQPDLSGKRVLRALMAAYPSQSVPSLRCIFEHMRAVRASCIADAPSQQCAAP